MAENEKKIIVDEDWKSQVEAEKEQLREKSENPEESSEEASPQGLPPASFETLISSLATQTMAFLGQFPEDDGRAMVSPPHAQHFIELLAVIQEKTEGNLSQEEAAMLENLLHQLRMLYVSVTDELKRQAAGGGAGGVPEGFDLGNLRTDEG